MSSEPLLVTTHFWYVLEMYKHDTADLEKG